MEKIKFNPSKEPTVGVEVESQIVDKLTGDLVNIAENIVASRLALASSGHSSDFRNAKS